LVWNLSHGEFLIKTREEFAKKNPVQDEIVRRYFINDEWQYPKK